MLFDLECPPLFLLILLYLLTVFFYQLFVVLVFSVLALSRFPFQIILTVRYLWCPRPFFSITASTLCGSV